MDDYQRPYIQTYLTIMYDIMVIFRTLHFLAVNDFYDVKQWFLELKRRKN